MRYIDQIAKNPDISKDELKALHSSVMNEAEQNYRDDVEIHGARAYIIGPSLEQGSANKADQVAHDFCQTLAGDIRLECTRPETQAEFKTFDESEEANASASSSSSSSGDPETNTIEVYLDPEVSELPIVYVNGKEQSYTASEKILRWND